MREELAARVGVAVQQPPWAYVVAVTVLADAIAIGSAGGGAARTIIDAAPARCSHPTNC